MHTVPARIYIFNHLFNGLEILCTGLSENSSSHPFAKGRRLPLFGKEGVGEIFLKCAFNYEAVIIVISSDFSAWRIVFKKDIMSLRLHCISCERKDVSRR
jgi:hypothetical protein